MKYMGSKSRVAKYIVPIIQQYINENNSSYYLEPFVGGANIIDKIKHKHKFGSDINPYLIGLFKHLQSDGELLKEVPRNLYNEVRADYKTGKYEDWFVGNVGFLASYNGRFFDGGYAQIGIEHTKHGDRVRNYYREASDNILAQKENIKDIEFSCIDYNKIQPHNAVIYCDPPYEGVKQYLSFPKFDYDEFWNTMRLWSEDNIVLISEINAPSDFECIWQKPVNRSVRADKKFEVTEKLFIRKENT